MPVNTDEQVRKGLNLLRTGLLPFVEQQMQKRYGNNWHQLPKVTRILHLQPKKNQGKPHLDTQALLNIIWNYWHDIFTHTLAQEQRNLVSELRMTRNKSAHEETFSIEDTYRVFDSIARLLTAVSAQEVTKVERIKQELMRELLCKQIEENAYVNTPPVLVSTQLATESKKSEFNCLKHVQTNAVIELPPNLSVIHIGKSNDQIPPDVDVSEFPNSDIVSRIHAAIRVEGDIYYIEDVGSSNGTYINDKLLLPGNPHRLQVDDRVALGKDNPVTFLFQLSFCESASVPSQLSFSHTTI